MSEAANLFKEGQHSSVTTRSRRMDCLHVLHSHILAFSRLTHKNYLLQTTKCVKYVNLKIFIWDFVLPALQNKGPEQLPFSNISAGTITVVLDVFNLNCQLYHNRICLRLLRCNKIQMLYCKINTPLTSQSHVRTTPSKSPRYKSILFYLHCSSRI
jgi:fumarate reductase subunit C